MNLYLLFHLNLMYSSIEEYQRNEVIQRCYWPLLGIANEGIPLGIELTGLTLEIINRLDKEWVREFKSLIESKKIELIGSGYSQIIGPLMPKRLNEKNLEIGLDVYHEILNVRPKIALINEMAYSCGLVDIYKEAGFEAIIMEWNNPYRFHKEWSREWEFSPCIAKGVNQTIPVIWADSIAFQKFQRYAHGEMPLREYVDYLNMAKNEKSDGYFPLYANDAEIFNFRPGRYKTEGLIEHNEWKRIRKLLCVLKRKGFNFVLPSKTLEGLNNVVLSLQAPQQPIPVKKQEKYNIIRWAITGRDDLYINTAINRILSSFDEKRSREGWKRLLYFASSDFRTHITQDRWSRFIDELESFSKKTSHVNKRKSVNPIRKREISQNRFYLTIQTDGVICTLNKTKGLTAKEVVFKNLSDKPLLGSLPHGYYDDISLGADFFSFHSIIERPGRHKCTNLKKANYTTEIFDDRIVISDRQRDTDIEFFKELSIFGDHIEIYVKIVLPERSYAIVHPMNITFIPDYFDKDSLSFSTHNGGDLETFHLRDLEVNHAESLSALISAKHGLGATEGIIIVGDRNRKLLIEHDRELSALIPSVFYKPVDGSFFLRIQYSAQEIDDTFLPDKRKSVIEGRFLIRAFP